MLAKTRKLGPFLGMNNRLPHHSLHVSRTQGGGASDYLANAINVDLDNTGRVSLRQGFIKKVTLAAGRSLFSDGLQTLCADIGVLCRLTLSSYTRHPLIAVHPTNPIAYAAVNGEIFFSDGVFNGRIAPAEEFPSLVGIPVPAFLTASLVAGNLPAATYQCTITYFYGFEEGGAFPSIPVTLQSTGGIRLTLPLPDGEAITGIGVYISGPNGEVPFFYTSVAEYAGTVDIVDVPTGRSCYTQFKFPLPPGNIMAHYNGRLLVAAGNVLYWSDAYNFGIVDALKGYAAFPAPISIVAPCVNGCYVVADKTYWLTALGTDAMDLPEVLPYGAVAGTLVHMPNLEKVSWMTAKGIVIADDKGQAQNMQEANIAVDTSARGGMLYRTDDEEKLICTLSGAITPPTAAHEDYTADELAR